MQRVYLLNIIYVVVKHVVAKLFLYCINLRCPLAFPNSPRQLKGHPKMHFTPSNKDTSVTILQTGIPRRFVVWEIK